MNLKSQKKKRLENNITKFYIHRILSSMFFSVPIMVLFWQKNGLSLTEIMILQSIFAISMVILEIPTGYFADMQGRRTSLFYSSIFGFLAFSVYSFSDNFLDFLIAELLFSLCVSLSSGTLSAFIYDTLDDLGRADEFQKIWGNSIFYGLITLAGANILGGYIGEIELRYTLYASVPFFALVIPLVLSMEEPSRHKSIISENYFQNLYKGIKNFLYTNPKLKWVIIYSSVVYAFNQTALWLYQPYFQLSGLEIVHFGYVFASFQIVAGISSKYAHKLEEFLGVKYSLIMLMFLVSVSYLLMSSYIYLFSFSFCFIQQLVRGFKKVVISDYINRTIGSSLRATILSLESFLSQLVYALIIPIIGWIADIYTLPDALLILALSSLISGSILLLFLRRVRVI